MALGVIKFWGPGVLNGWGLGALHFVGVGLIGFFGSWGDRFFRGPWVHKIWGSGFRVNMGWMGGEGWAAAATRAATAAATQQKLHGKNNDMTTIKKLQSPCHNGPK